MYKFKKLNGVPVNATSAKLRCRTCTGEQAHELKCQGQCGTWKPLDAFSKSQRRNGQKVSMILIPNSKFNFTILCQIIPMFIPSLTLSWVDFVDPSIH
jgi:hypothetical protein